MNSSEKVYAIVLAAGKGLRMKAKTNKMFVDLAGRVVLAHTLEAFEEAGCIDGIIVACRPEEKNLVRRLAEDNKGITLVDGGETRQDSVKNALKAVPGDARFVAVHDGARCFVTAELIQACVESARKFGSGVAGKRAVDTVKLITPEGQIKETIDRTNVVLVETPQVFETEILKAAFEKAEKDHFVGTDESSLVERMGITPHLVESETYNNKLTNPMDLEQGRIFMTGTEETRIGNGFDAHRLVEGRKLILGGVEIQYDKGLEAHSDGDVLVHAIIDAMLGAAGLPDIGELFPDNENEYKNINSLLLLKRAAEELYDLGYSIGNIDATLIMQQPKVGIYKQKMRENIAEVLQTNLSKINIKATTTERLGAFGRGEGIGAEAVCILNKHRCFTY